MKKIETVDQEKYVIAPWVEEYVKSKVKDVTKPKELIPPIIDIDDVEEDLSNRNPTDPIKSLDDVERLKEYILNRKGHKNVNLRDYAYFVLSLNICRRAGDILALHVYDVLNIDGSFKTHITFEHEQKTGKKSIILLNSKSKEALTLYFNSFNGKYKMSDWLFPKSNNPSEHMSVDGMRRMLQRAAAALNIDMHMGTHSLRKTMPYHIISTSKNTEDEVIASQVLGHRNIKNTYHYICRGQDILDQYMEIHGL